VWDCGLGRAESLARVAALRPAGAARLEL